MKDENIFESVQFINESSTNSFWNGFGKLLKTAVDNFYDLNKILERKRIKGELSKALKWNKNLSILRSKLKQGTRVISVDSLSNRVKLSDKDKDIIKSYDISVLAMVDKQDNIIAYCMVDPHKNAKKNDRIRYGYTIVDKSIGTSKDVEMFIKASFEFKIGVYGEGIKYFTDNPYNYEDYRGGKNLEEDLDKNANYLTGKSADEFSKKIKDLTDLIVSKSKSLFNDLEFDDVAYGKTSSTIYFNSKELLICDNEDDAKKEEKLYNNCIKIFDKLMKSIGFENSTQYGYKSSIDKYTGIIISFENDEDDFIHWYYINIRTNRSSK